MMEKFPQPGSSDIEIERDLGEHFNRYLKDFALSLEDLRGKNVLDVGADTQPDFVEYCLRNGITKDIYAMDIRPYNSDSESPAKEKFFETAESKSHFIQGDVLKMPIKIDKFDLVLMRCVPVDEVMEKLVDEIIDKLPKGGEFRISPVFRDGPYAENMAKISAVLKARGIAVEYREAGFVESEDEIKERSYKDVVIFRKV